MQVNRDLIRKYAQNKCSQEERLEVEYWLANHNEQVPNELSITEEQSAKAVIWSAINAKTRSRQNSFSFKKMTIAAAAAALIGLFLYININPLIISRTITITNPSSEQTRQLLVGDLRFFIEPGSSVSVQVPLLGYKASTVSFCGAISVENNSTRDKNIAIRTGSFECSEMNAKDMVRLHKGQTFLAMTDKDYHLISATKKELEDGLPGAFSLRLSQKFKL